MSRTHKWPVKALNLLVALAMAISMLVVLVPQVSGPASAQGPVLVVTITEPDPGDDICISQNFTVAGNITNTGNETAFDVDVSIEVTDGWAHLVAGTTPQTIDFILVDQTVQVEWTLHCDAGGNATIQVKAEWDASEDTDEVIVNQEPDCLVYVNTYEYVAGELVPDTTFAVCDDFYVNAAVTNPTGESWANVTAVIENVVAYTGTCTGTDYFEFQNTTPAENVAKFIGTIPSREVGDAWWAIHCCNEGLSKPITVTAYTNYGTGQEALLCSDTILVTQLVTEVPDIVVTIVEPLEDPYELCVCQQFVVKAEIENMGNQTWTNVNATITFPASQVELAYVAGGTGEPDPATWELDDLGPYATHVVAWQLHCKGAGTGTIEVDVTADETPEVQSDSFIVDQASLEAAFSVVSFAIDDETICAECGQTFRLTAPVCNVGCHPASGVTATLAIIEGDPADVDLATGQGMVFDIGALEAFGGDNCLTAYWDFECLHAGNVTFEVVVDGTDTVTGDPIATFTTGNITVYQLPLVVEITDPITSDYISVCQNFEIEATVWNCDDAERINVEVTIDLPAGTELADGSIVVIKKYSSGGILQETQTVDPAVETVTIDKLCTCCYAEVIWTLHCTKAVQGTVTVTALDDGDTDSDTVIIYQECKAHLMAGIEAFSGAMSLGDFQTWASRRVSVGDTFTLIVPVTNVGGASASSVQVTIDADGPATTTDSLTQSIGTIPGLETVKAIWEFECTAEGTVEFTVTNITGNDVNTGVAIHQDNIDKPCPIEVEQVVSEMTVEILNPLPGEEIDVCTDFSVKALITNTGDDTIEGVAGTIYWSQGGVAYDGADLILEPGSVVQPLTKGAGDILPAGWAEVSWVLHCTDPGDLYIKVTATSVAPAHIAVDDVTVVQIGKPNVDIVILSPPVGVYIATSQEFAVTARVSSIGSEPAEAVYASIDPGLHASLVAGDNPVSLGVMAPDTEEIVTWTLHCDGTGELQCAWGNTTICVSVETTSEESSTADNDECKQIHQYPAAHLVVAIGEMTTTISVCDEFVVPFTVTNTGEADATEVSVTLSVTPEDSVRIAEGDQGYTKTIGTLTGWGEDGSYSGTFNLHCKQACESTITITAAGIDECGWEIKQLCDYDQDGNEFVCELYPHSQPYLPIPDKFIEPDSVTVKQIAGLDLGITKTADKSFAEPEEEVVFTITVTNYGPTNASGVVVTDSWSPTAELSYESHTVTQGTFDSGTGVWTVGGLVAGASATLVLTTSVGPTPVAAVTNTATITAVVQIDGDPSNDSASVTLNEAAVTSVDIDLDAVWNLISLPLIPDDSDIEVVMAGVDVVIVWAYDAATTTWTSWDSVFGGDLDDMVDGKGYWVNMNTADTLTVNGVELPLPPSTPPTYGVVVGWNLIGFKSTTARTAGDYLAAIAGDWTRIYGYANGAFFVVESGDSMQPGFGYWLAVIAAGTIYP